MAGKEAPKPWSPGEADARPPAVFGRRNRWEGRHRERQCRIPQRVRSGLPLHCLIVEQVGRLAVVRPGDPEIEREVVLDFEIITEIHERVALAEAERRVSRRNPNTVRNVLRKRGPVCRAELAVEVRQEYVWRTLLCVINTCLQDVTSQEPCPAV